MLKFIFAFALAASFSPSVHASNPTFNFAVENDEAKLTVKAADYWNIVAATTSFPNVTEAKVSYQNTYHAPDYTVCNRPAALESMVRDGSGAFTHRRYTAMGHIRDKYDLVVCFYANGRYSASIAGEWLYLED